MKKSVRKLPLWLIKREERPLFLLLALLLFVLSFNHIVLHDIKDTLIVGYMGPEFLAFMKFWIILPGAVIFFFVYSKLSQHLSQGVILVAILSLFAAFFMLFSFYLFPTLHFDKHPTVLADQPLSFRDLIDYWDIVLFYLLSELWGNIALGLLFWGFANRVIRLSVAKRFYTPLNLATAIGGIFGGLMGSWLSSLAHRSGLGYDLTLKVLSTIVTVNIVIGIIFYLRTKNILKDHAHLLQRRPQKEHVAIENFWQSLKIVAGSKFLLLIAVIVLCFGLSFNLVEIIWKSQIKSLFSDLNRYGQFTSGVSIVQGIVSAVVILLGAGIIPRIGWLKAALLTPLIVGITCLLFFSATFANKYVHVQASWFVVLPVYLGALHFIAIRTCRLAFFEPTKEMAFIPLNRTLKTQGKAAVDVMADRVGKGCGSLLQYTAISWLGSVISFAPYAFGLAILFFALWVYSIILLWPQFKDRIRATRKTSL